MLDKTRGNIQTTIYDRECDILRKLRENDAYRKALEERDEMPEKIERIKEKLDDEEQDIINSAIGDMDDSQCMEFDALYLGGIKDCFSVLLYFSGLTESIL